MKTSAIIRIILCVVLLALLIGVVILAVRWQNGDFDWNWNWKSFSMGSYTYKDSKDYIAGARDIDPSGIQNVEINWIGGEINVAYGEGSQISLSEDSGLSEDDQLHSLVKGDTLYIQFCAPRTGIYSMPENKRLTVTLPKGMKLNRLDIDAVSAQGDIQGIQAAYCRVDNVSGEYTLTDCSFRDLKIDTVSGECSFSGTAQTLDMDTVSGGLTAALLAPVEEISMDSVSGELELYIPEGMGFRAEIDSVSGDLECSLPMSKKGDTYICGDGAAEIEMDTVSGDMSIAVIDEGKNLSA